MRTQLNIFPLLNDRKRSLLIYHSHKIMIATSAHECIQWMLSVLRLSSERKKRLLHIRSVHSKTNRVKTPTLRERERERWNSKPQITHIDFPLFHFEGRDWLSRKSPNTPLLSALVTSDWLRVHKSNNPTTTKHRTFFHFLIQYQHIYKNLVIWTFYLICFQYNC